MSCLQMMTYRLIVASTIFQYDRSELQVTGEEMNSAFEVSFTRQFFAAFTIAICVLLFFYSFFFVLFWYIEKRRIATTLPLFAWITFGMRTADDITLPHVLTLATSMVVVVMLIITGFAELLIKNIFIRMIGVWF